MLELTSDFLKSAFICDSAAFFFFAFYYLLGCRLGQMLTTNLNVYVVRKVKLWFIATAKVVELRSAYYAALWWLEGQCGSQLFGVSAPSCVALSGTAYT